MEKLAMKKEKVVFDLSVENAEVEAKVSNSFGEEGIEKRWVQIPRESYRRFITYEEWREKYRQLIAIEDYGKPLNERTPEWVKERAIKIYWEEALDNCEKQMCAKQTTRPFSPDIQAIEDYSIFAGENFEHIWNDDEEEWKETLKKFHNRKILNKDEAAAAQFNSKKKTNAELNYIRELPDEEE